MKRLIKFSLLNFFVFASNSLFGQQYQTITGRYYNQIQNSINCNCNVQGYVHYYASDGNTYYKTVCFDSEPGSFYQIYDGEEITVEGYTVSKTCANGKTYSVMDVSKTTLNPAMQRQMLYLESTKRQGKSTTTKQSGASSNEAKETTYSMSGFFTLRGSTKDDWSLFDGVNCKACGRFDHRRDVIVNFERIGITSENLYNIGNIKVYGTFSGNTLTVTRWERIK